jgi:hypothetical protein
MRQPQRLGAARRSEPMHLTDHGIASNAAKLRAGASRICRPAALLFPTP